MPRARCPSYLEVFQTPPFAPSGANYEQILSIYLSIGCGYPAPTACPPAPPPFCSGPDSASMSCEPSTSNSPEATQASATGPTKPPHGYYPVRVRSRRQSWSLEEEEPHSDTAVDDTAAGTSEPLAALPKDNDDNGSEYTASSSDEGPVPAKRCRESARLRGVRAPTPHLSGSPFSEGRGRKRSRSQSEESVPERTPPPVMRGSPGALKRPTKPNVRSHLTDFLRIHDLAYPRAQPHTQQVSDTRPTYKPTNRVDGKADGVGRPDTPSGSVHANVIKRLRQYNRAFSARPPRKPQPQPQPHRDDIRLCASHCRRALG
ncbi:hypothetical protein EDB83DRAFT_183795 [Lactarius deliciosus]|nr:hypothetical protein EDB83DRAFT_183795 [Lactarius deliciosus]